MAAPAAIDIAPNGDVVLICGGANDGDPLTKLRVSSQVLGLASPVFRRMLSGDFKEGKQLADNGAVEIPLPDDDGPAMEIMCRILHLQHYTVSGSLIPPEVFEIAVVSDKYECSEAMALVADHWIGYYINGVTDDDRQSLLISAFLFRRHEKFEELGQRLVLENTTRINSVSGSSAAATSLAADRLRRVLDELEKQRKTGFERINSFIEDEMVLRCGMGEHTCPRPCHWPGKYGVSFIEQLRAVELWGPKLVSNRSLAKTLEVMRSTTWQMPVRGDGGICTMECFLRKMESNDEVGKKFQRMAGGIEQKTGKLCLECVLAGSALKASECAHSATNALMTFGH